MLRPTHGIADCSRLVRPGCIRKHFRNFEEMFPGNSADRLNELRRITREMTLQHVENAARVLKRGIGIVLMRIAGFSAPIFAVTPACAGMARSRSIAVLGRTLV